jgi:hypothetical protein
LPPEFAPIGLSEMSEEAEVLSVPAANTYDLILEHFT